jgi:hypothetical protein
VAARHHHRHHRNFVDAEERLILQITIPSKKKPGSPGFFN